MSRDRTVGDTFYILFTTRAFATGIPTTLAGTPVVSAYEDNSIAQITAGITLGVDHDSVSGLNLLTIVATGGNGFETGKDYNLAVTAGTVGGVSVIGEVVGQFSLSLSASAKDLANGTDGLGAIKADTAATLFDTGTDGVVVAAASKTGYALSTAGILAIWNQLTSALTTASTIGKLIVDNLNATVSSRATQTSIDDIPTNAEFNARTLPSANYFDPTADDVTVGTNNDKTGYSLSTAGIKAIWDQLTSALTTVSTIGKLLVDNINATISSRSSQTSVDDVPNNAEFNARTLLAANYATASALATAQADLDTITGSDGATLATLQPNEDFGAITKNAAFSNFPFLMVLTSDHVTPATGLTVTGQRQIDGGAFTGVSGTISEISNGIYQFDALAADTNGDVITWRFSSATADDTFVSLKTVS